MEKWDRDEKIEEEGIQRTMKAMKKMSLKHFPFYKPKFPNTKYWDMH